MLSLRNSLSIAALVLFGACVIDTPEPVAARFQLAWSFDGGGDCETLGVEIIQVNMVFDGGGGQLTDQFLCVDQMGVTHPVETDEAYSLQLVAYDADGNELGRSESRTETVLGTGQTVEVEPFIIDTSG